MADGRSKGVRNPAETRRKLVDAAAMLFHRRRFQGCGVQEIYEVAGLTRGALFHHFKDKSQLGVAVIRGPIADWIRETWIMPLRGSDTVASAIKAGLEGMRERSRRDEDYRRFGCPFAAMVAEMAGLDEPMARELRKIRDEWQDLLLAGFTRDKNAGKLHRSIRPADEAAMLIGAVSGLSLLPALDAKDVFLENGLRAFEAYLETLIV